MKEYSWLIEWAAPIRTKKFNLIVHQSDEEKLRPLAGCFGEASEYIQFRKEFNDVNLFRNENSGYYWLRIYAEPGVKSVDAESGGDLLNFGE